MWPLQLKSNWILHKYKADFSSIEGNLVICFFHPRVTSFHTQVLSISNSSGSIGPPMPLSSKHKFFGKFLSNARCRPHTISSVTNIILISAQFVCTSHAPSVPFNPENCGCKFHTLSPFLHPGLSVLVSAAFYHFTTTYLVQDRTDTVQAAE